VPPPDETAGPATPAAADSDDGRPRGLLPARGFRRTGAEVRCRGWRIDMVKASFESPDGTVFTRDVVRHPGAVAVVPVTDRSTVLLVRQYRGTLDGDLLELPAGTRDVDGEPPEVTAGRELSEEVGVRAGALRLLAAVANTPGFSDQITLLYLATGLQPVPTGRQGPEESHMEVVELPLQDAVGMVMRGELLDAETMLGLMLAREVLGSP